MIRISQLKLKYTHTPEELEQKLLKTLRIGTSELISYRIFKQSVDARKKPDIFYVYTVDAAVKQEQTVLKKCKSAVRIAPKSYQVPESGTEKMKHRPVVIGSGPAGLFCAYLLAREGYRPILVERGAPVEERMTDVRKFWNTGILNPTSNVQFGEGGAGTFSDGKLNTLVKDPVGRNRFVLETFVRFGAPESILYENKPHIGTDILTGVVRNLRDQIIAWGGEVHFHSQVTDLRLDDDGALCGLEINEEQILNTRTAVLAIGHSARDTFFMLHEKKVPMTAKSFAVGVRVEHPQTMINHSQYGMEHPEKLPAASYKLTATAANGRGVYSFCMCPGGYVVNASSEEGLLAVNGMSYHGRAGENANSAIIVTVTPEDYEDDHPLAGIAFQRRLEQHAFETGGGKIPVQRLEDFCANRTTVKTGHIIPNSKGDYCLANLRPIFPDAISDALEDGIHQFDRKIAGFSDLDTILSGVESRTSSPVKIPRGDTLESGVRGLYPCGEGAGYAGGITSAAMDGIKVFEAIAMRHAPL
ncbi:NAD(P)/FAD-dependent oxidoreductase [Hespellia stercorisuis]|uniref:FAD-dependent protein C-terminal domain-containing protein n=1 Tax=Hespellia stercorisuis DSM 15480 TaxID=1121950 RepID=A0A1M6N3Y0_9FIRM|nr:NAD(P)-binding protein [Hespellia stercorisuis]SHJ90372.1 hypothetical protein SAMN02745243_01703 [Hespellia stercorisuis DSM 15480]